MAGFGVVVDDDDGWRRGFGGRVGGWGDAVDLGGGC